jgi:hypothetical protein
MLSVLRHAAGVKHGFWSAEAGESTISTASVNAGLAPLAGTVTRLLTAALKKMLMFTSGNAPAVTGVPPRQVRMRSPASSVKPLERMVVGVGALAVQAICVCACAAGASIRPAKQNEKRTDLCIIPPGRANPGRTDINTIPKHFLLKMFWQSAPINRKTPHRPGAGFSCFVLLYWASRRISPAMRAKALFN